VKKNTIILLVILLTTIVGTDKLIFASDNAAEKLQTNISVKGTLILQAMTAEKPNNYGGIYNTYTTSLDIEKELKNNAKITVSLKGGISNYTIDRNNLTYSTINKDANSKDLYIETIYHKSFFCNKLNIDLGKFGLSKHFDKNTYADDTSTQFLTGSFVSNKTIESLDDRLGLRLNYTFSKFDIDYGYFSLIKNKFDNNGFNILQISYKPSKKENYRVYGWMDNRKYFIYKEKKDNKLKARVFGIGASLDREINKQLGIFARFGYKDPSIQTTINNYNENSNNISDFITPSLLLSVGAQIKGSSWSRANDIIGLAIGQIYTSNLKECNKNYKYHAETQMELYYKLEINDNIAITPNLQYIAHTKDDNNNLFIYGIKTHFKF